MVLLSRKKNIIKSDNHPIMGTDIGMYKGELNDRGTTKYT
jgi:hypothetical protein